jgi:hypothetical protein
MVVAMDKNFTRALSEREVRINGIAAPDMVPPTLSFNIHLTLTVDIV